MVILAPNKIDLYHRLPRELKSTSKQKDFKFGRGLAIILHDSGLERPRRYLERKVSIDKRRYACFPPRHSGDLESLIGYLKPVCEISSEGKEIEGRGIWS